MDFTSSDNNATSSEEKPGWWISSVESGLKTAAGSDEHGGPISLSGGTDRRRRPLPVPPSSGAAPLESDIWTGDPSVEAAYRSSTLPGNPPNIWSTRPLLGSARRDDAQLERVLEMSRNEYGVASTALSIIVSTMMNQNVDVISASTTLEDLRLQCLQADVSFAELLEKNVDGYGMPPLAIETSRCDFEGAPDLLFFLAEHTASHKKMKYITQGCMLRKDNLFEKLQSMLGPSANPDAPQEYVVSSEQYATPYTSVIPDKHPRNTFRALISIPNFTMALQRRANDLDIRRQHASTRSPGSEDSSSINDAGLVIELVALGRYWELVVGRNRLALWLIDGQDCSVDASLSVIEEQLGDLAPAVLYSLENPGVPIPEKIPPSAPRLDSKIGTTTENLMFDKPTKTYVDMIMWIISCSPDKRAKLPDICKKIADQYPYYKDDVHYSTLKSAVRQRLVQKPYFKFLKDQEGKGLGWTYNHLLDDNEDMDINEDASQKAEHLEHDSDENELTAALAAVVIDGAEAEARASETTGDLSSETKSKTSLDLLMTAASNPSGNPSPPTDETTPAATTGTPGSFFFPPTTLYPSQASRGARTHCVEIPRCFSLNSRPSSFMEATLQSHQLLVQLVVRLYDERDGLETSDPIIHAKISSSIGATGPGSSFAGGSTYRSKAGSSSTGGWSVIHDDDMFDTDGTEKGDEDSDGGSTEDDGSCFSDLG
ncbi:hypothetical protein FRB95_011589 [Tulasnella sp. JGI-2019a]|nr:hypothetical protein FRB93_004814 [Tulasnella sp. JGI-2019a]KAG9035294.1 hypothetical protein FRB95_011589 [Tulasnella sp. JGI-2019a]